MSDVYCSDDLAPYWHDSRSLSKALYNAHRCFDRSSAMNACGSLLDSVGNEHSATYFPIATTLVPMLEDLLTSEQPWPRFAALQALICLSGSFEPELGYASMTLPDGSTGSTAVEVHRTITKLTPLLVGLKQSSAGANEERELVAEILESLRSSSTDAQ